MRRVEKLVVGLGNPGPRYERTRHNAGFRVVDRVANRWGVIFEPARKLEGYEGPRDFEFAKLLWDLSEFPTLPTIDPWATLLVKPRTFMNLSGDVVAPILSSRNLAPADLLVVYDDLDLPLGAKRIRPHGGAGTHNGMRSIVDRLASDRFPRLRLGIGTAGTDAARHVLEDFTEDEEKVIERAADEAADAICFWIATGDLDACMTRYHSRWKEGDESRPQT
jgi:PTH1 family peptidyl-tRNA hydrolase